MPGGSWWCSGTKPSLPPASPDPETKPTPGPDSPPAPVLGAMTSQDTPRVLARDSPPRPRCPGPGLPPFSPLWGPDPGTRPGPAVSTCRVPAAPTSRDNRGVALPWVSDCELSQSHAGTPPCSLLIGGRAGQ